MSLNECVEYVYLLQTREFKNLNKNIYKIGKTKQTNDKRFKSYPKGSILLFQCICYNCDHFEKGIINYFKVKYRQCLEIGKEYFEGDYLEMINDIYSKNINYLIINKKNVNIEIKKTLEEYEKENDELNFTEDEDVNIIQTNLSDDPYYIFIKSSVEKALLENNYIKFLNVFSKEYYKNFTKFLEELNLDNDITKWKFTKTLTHKYSDFIKVKRNRIDNMYSINILLAIKFFNLKKNKSIVSNNLDVE